MANVAPRFGRKCPKGHTMDPNWPTCPYCASEQRANQKSRSPDIVAASEDRRTSVGEVPLRGGRRETRAMAPAVEPYASGHVGAGDTRRIVGALITYTWDSAGELFPVKEGKNFIGAGEVHSDASHQLCDILISRDTRMSAEHALILYRQGRYEIYDQQSSNGTFLGNELLPMHGTELPNNAVIRTGSTYWSFVKLAPPQEAEKVLPPADQLERRSGDKASERDTRIL